MRLTAWSDILSDISFVGIRFTLWAGRGGVDIFVIRVPCSIFFSSVHSKAAIRICRLLHEYFND